MQYSLARSLGTAYFFTRYLNINFYKLNYNELLLGLLFLIRSRQGGNILFMDGGDIYYRNTCFFYRPYYILDEQ
jgi:hypothetical protein